MQKMAAAPQKSDALESTHKSLIAAPAVYSWSLDRKEAADYTTGKQPRKTGSPETRNEWLTHRAGAQLVITGEQRDDQLSSGEQAKLQGFDIHVLSRYSPQQAAALSAAS